MAMNQRATGVSVINSLNGLGSWSFTNWTTSAVSAIAQGSAFDVGGAWFVADSDTAINASSLTAIATASACYVYVTPSGTAGSQILTPYATTTAAVWVDAKQGWYASAASTSRYLGGMYKTGTSSWERKWIAPPQHVLARITFDIGDWNMDSTAAINIAHGLPSPYKIIRANAEIWDDIISLYSMLSGPDGTIGWTGANLQLSRVTGGLFDSTDYDSTGFNRGRVTIEYEL